MFLHCNRKIAHQFKWILHHSLCSHTQRVRNRMSSFAMRRYCRCFRYSLFATQIFQSFWQIDMIVELTVQQISDLMRSSAHIRSEDTARWGWWCVLLSYFIFCVVATADILIDSQEIECSLTAGLGVLLSLSLSLLPPSSCTSSSSCAYTTEHNSCVAHKENNIRFKLNFELAQFDYETV